MNKPLLVTTVVLSLASFSATGWFYYTGQLMQWLGMAEPEAAVAEAAAPAAPEPPPEPRYVKMDPPFLVNFEMNGTLRFLQVSLELMAREPDVVKAVETHTPHLRNNILMLLSDQTIETIATLEAKEQLRDKILKEVRFVLTQLTGGPGVEAVYFTSFVMQ